jgi:hypothetical protein
MNPPQRRLTTYAVAAFVFLFILCLVCRYALRETSSSARQEPPTIEPARPEPRQAALPDLASPEELQPQTPASQPENVAVTNAAALYRQAFALYAALSKDEKGILADWRTNVDASVEAELCEKIRPICDIMHKATAVTNCDWGVEPITIDSQLPHLNPAHAVSRAAIWNAAHCRREDRPGAAEDVLSTLQLGRSVSHSALIGSLVDMAIQGIAESYVAANIGMFRGSESQRLSVLLTDPAYKKVPAVAMEQEATISESLIAKMAALPADEFQRVYSELVKEETPTDQPGEGMSEMDRAAVLANLQQVVESQRALARALASGSADEYYAWLQQRDELEQSNPLAKTFLTFDKYVERADRAAINRAFVEAGLAVEQEGPSALQSHPDPSTGQPFVYTETFDGFDLQSGFKTNGVPLKMQFK